MRVGTTASSSVRTGVHLLSRGGAMAERMRNGAVAAQEATARVFLAAVAPQASFHVYKYRSSDV